MEQQGHTHDDLQRQEGTPPGHSKNVQRSRKRKVASPRHDQTAAGQGLKKRRCVTARNLQNKGFRFHDNHGEEVVLTNDQQTAEYRRDLAGDGIVMSRDPMNVNKLYEVRVTKTNQRRDWSLWVGVVTSSPDSLAVPDWARGWQSAVYVTRDCFLDHGEETLTNIGKDLVDLPQNSRVGVSVDRSRQLHLHVNGVDQGVVPCRSLPDPCWAMWQLWGRYREITSLPVTDVS